MITNNASIQTTSHKAVIPFYVYAAVAFLAGCMMLFLSTDAFDQHHFHPKTLAITHVMALGWGTMIILGASYQLVPVLVESKLYDSALAYISFALAGTGIPLLAYGFHTFNMGWPSVLGGILINLAVIAYGINLLISMVRGKARNVHAVFVITATGWLMLTTLLGLVLVLNFKTPFLAHNSLRYLSLHAHMGIAGWFLMLVLGVGARLIPMFMISKYTNDKLLWTIFAGINAGLVMYVVGDLLQLPGYMHLIPAGLVGTGILLFAAFCRRAYQQRIRKQIDVPMRVSLASVIMMAGPLLLLVGIVIWAYFSGLAYRIGLLYGFFIFFGWLTAIILGMTFKTLPFIVWNKVYHKRAGRGKTPTPKELFSESVFHIMAWHYAGGFVCFAAGLALNLQGLLKVGAGVLVIAAFLYTLNIVKIVFHKPLQL